MSFASAVWCNFNGNLVIKTFDENFRARNVIPKIRPYFFVKSADLERCREALKSSGKVSSIESGDFYTFGTRQPCAKVECFWPYDVKDLRQALEASGIQTYEADISFVRRWMIDENIYPSQSAAVLFWDMECDCREGLAFADKPSARILSFAAVDHNGKEFFICDNDEEEMVNQFLGLIRNYPILVGWNNLNWDLPYLTARSKVLGFNYPFKYHQHMDMMILYDKSDYGSYSSLKLDDVAHKELNAGKTFSIEGIGGAEALWKMFLNDKDRLKEYNLQDARLVQMLENKLNLLKIQFNISSFVGILLSDTNYVSRIIDTMIFRRLIKEPVRLVLKNRQFNSEKISFPGGYVHQPDRALHKWVFEYDFKSLYPSIIITFNVGLDSKDENGDILTEKARFTSKREARVVKLLRELQAQRNLAKKERDKYPMGSPEWNKYHALQITYKLISNSFWGALGESVGRMFDLDLAESITLTGQAIIKETMKIFDELGMKSLYADSVTGETLIPIIKNGAIYKTTIEELFENYVDRAEKIGEKECVDLSKENLETFAIDDNGKLHIDKIRKVIRHKTDKKIFTVNTPFGSIRVTEDHSLIVKNSKGCYPCQVKDLNADAKLIYLDVDYESLRNLRKRNKWLFALHSGSPNKKQTRTHGEISQCSYSFCNERTKDSSGATEENVRKDERSMEASGVQAAPTSEGWGKISLESETLEQGINQSFSSAKIQRQHGEAERENFTKIKTIFLESSRGAGETSRKCGQSLSNASNCSREIDGRIISESIENSQESSAISVSSGHNETGLCDKCNEHSPGNLCGWVFPSLLSQTLSGSSEGYSKANSRPRRGSDEILIFNGDSSEQILGMRSERKSSENSGCSEKPDFRYFGETTVLSVEPEGSSTQYVYDLEVDRHHTFLANKIFVHNTDSCFVAVPKELAGCSGEVLAQKAKILEKIANNALAERLIKKYNIPKERYSIVLEFQNLFHKVFFTGKKKQYIGQVYSREKTATLRDMSTSDFGINTNISLVGLSMKKYNTCRFLKMAQKQILDNILASDSLEDARGKVRNICLNIKKLLYSHALDDCLVQRTGVRKDLSAYKVNSIQRTLGKQLQACGLFRRGDVLDYVIVDVKDGKLIPKVLTNKDEKVHPTHKGLEYYENLLSAMVERLLGEKINLENNELDKWL